MEQGRAEPGHQAHNPLDAGLGVVVHRGRRTGRVYQTPVNVFATGDGYVLALTNGPDANWVKNVLAQAAANCGRAGASCA